MKKLYYIKWHYSQSNVNYWICFAESTKERDDKFQVFCKENNLELGAYSPRELVIPENGTMLPFN